MNRASDSGPGEVLAHALPPVVNEEDALSMATPLKPYLPGHVAAPHVSEQGGSAPDKTPLEQSTELAADSYPAVRTVLPDANDHTSYANDVVGAIFGAVDKVDASAIAYRAWSGGRIMQFLSDDLSLKRVTNVDRPVNALLRVDSNA